MDEIKYRNFLSNKTKSNGEPYTVMGIEKRVDELVSLEVKLGYNIDTIIQDRENVINVLRQIRVSNWESQKHTPKSNALRLYYECCTGDKIGKLDWS